MATARGIAEYQGPSRSGRERRPRPKSLQIDSIQRDVDLIFGNSQLETQPITAGMIYRNITPDPGEFRGGIGPANPAVAEGNGGHAREGEEGGDRLEPVMPVNDVRGDTETPEIVRDWNGRFPDFSSNGPK